MMKKTYTLHKISMRHEQSQKFMFTYLTAVSNDHSLVTWDIGGRVSITESNIRVLIFYMSKYQDSNIDSNDKITSDVWSMVP